MDNASLLAIKSELTNDPQALGLDTNPAHDEANANALNLVRQTISIKKRWLSTADLFNAVSPLEHQALTDQQSRYLTAVLELGQFDPFTNATIVDGLIGAQNGMFGAQSDSNPAIAAALVQPGSRVQQMYQAGLLSSGNDLSPSDIANARAAT